MQFDWTTFALEGLNFLVLMWILTRFLYRPVLGVLDARRKAVADQVGAAQKTRAEAEAIKAQYEARLSDWQKEREQARQALASELAAERGARLEALAVELGAERDKAAQRDAVAAASRAQAQAREAAANAYRHAGAMLQRLASDQLTARIAAMFEQDLRGWDAARRAGLIDAAAALRPGEAACVSSAHPLDDAARQQIAQALEHVLGSVPPLQFALAPELVAGLRVALGPCLLQASLADELEFFRTQDAHD